MSLIRSSMLVSALSLGISGISFVNQLVIARLFGTTQALDAYLVASSLPFLFSGTISAVLSYSLIPALIAHRSQSTDLHNSFLTVCALCFAILSILTMATGYLLAPQFSFTLSAAYNEVDRIMVVSLSRLSWITSGFGIFQAFLAAKLNSDKRYYLPITGSAFPYLGMIILGLLFGQEWGPQAIAWGMLIGTCIACLLTLGNPLSWISSTIQTEDLNDLKKYLSGMPFMFLAMSCFTIFQTIDAFWAPRVGTGALSQLGYCQRLLIAIGNLVIAGPSVVLVPRFTEAHVEGRTRDFLADLAKTLRMIIACAVPVTVVISVLAEPTIRLLFQRGAFSQEATQSIATILPYMLTGMIAMLCVVIIFRALNARGQVKLTAFLGAMSVVLYFLLSGLLSPLLGTIGIALAYLISWASVCITACILIWWPIAWLRVTIDVGIFTLKLASASIGSIFTVKLFSLWIDPSSTLCLYELAGSISALFIAGLASFCLLSIYIFRIEEIKQLINALSSKLSHTSPVCNTNIIQNNEQNSILTR